MRAQSVERFISAADDMDLIAIGENLKHAAHAKQVIRWRNQIAWSWRRWGVRGPLCKIAHGLTGDIEGRNGRRIRNNGGGLKSALVRLQFRIGSLHLIPIYIAFQNDQQDPVIRIEFKVIRHRSQDPLTRNLGSTCDVRRRFARRLREHFDAISGHEPMQRQADRSASSRVLLGRYGSSSGRDWMFFGPGA